MGHPPQVVVGVRPVQQERRPELNPQGASTVKKRLETFDRQALRRHARAKQCYPGQPRQMYDLLRARRECVKPTKASGVRLHCSPMAPQQHYDVVFDWLADVLQR